MDLPFERSYWVDPGGLTAGAYPGHTDRMPDASRKDDLVRCVIRWVVNLMEPGEKNREGHPFAPYDEALRGRATCTRFPLPDMGIPSTGTMVAILDTIDAALGREEPVYVSTAGEEKAARAPSSAVGS